jgi:hypothetical protein
MIDRVASVVMNVDKSRAVEPRDRGFLKTISDVGDD